MMLHSQSNPPVSQLKFINKIDTHKGCMRKQSKKYLRKKKQSKAFCKKQKIEPDMFPLPTDSSKPTPLISEAVTVIESVVEVLLQVEFKQSRRKKKERKKVYPNCAKQIQCILNRPFFPHRSILSDKSPTGLSATLFAWNF